MTYKPYLLSVLLFFCWCPSAANAVSVQLVPSATTASVGDTILLDITISGLGAPGPEEVGSFDVFIGFDPSMFAPTGVSFGLLLGDPLLFEALTDSSATANVVEAAEVSLLSVAELRALQPSSFTLATFSFEAIASGAVAFQNRGGPIDDGLGNLIAGTKTPLPEPSPISLILAALLGCAGFGIWNRPRKSADKAIAPKAICPASGRAVAKTLGLATALVFLVTDSGLADDPSGLASNDFGNNGEGSVPASAYAPGKKERDSAEYKKENPDAAKRDYYEKGGKTANHDSKCRAKIAYQAARYQGPKNGYEAGQTTENAHKDGPRPKAGGGNYAAEMPKDPDQIINNIYKFVEDMTYPKRQPSDFQYDSEICDLVKNGTIDIGKPRVGNEFMCMETIHFFTSLVRELGFPVREKNVLPSFANGSYDVQTAASNVWYGGKWHFFDPWESLKDSKEYLTGTGHAGYVGPNSFHDADIWVRTGPPIPTVRDGNGSSDYSFKSDGTTTKSGWKKIERHKKNGAQIDSQTFSLRIGVQDNMGRITGGTSGMAQVDIPASIYVAHDKPVQESHEAEPGPDTYDTELVILLYADNEPTASLGYNLMIHNPSQVAQTFDVNLAPLSSTVDISVSPPQVTGSIQPDEMRVIPFTVNIGPALSLPPPEVKDARIGAQQGTVATVTWSPVAGATQYNIYRSPAYFEDTGDSGVVFVSSTTNTAFPVEVANGDVVGIEAVGPLGLLAALDTAESGSTTVATVCDINLDHVVDRQDVNAIFAARNSTALPGDSRDLDGDGLLTTNDARICTLQCTNTRCAP